MVIYIKGDIMTRKILWLGILAFSIAFIACDDGLTDKGSVLNGSWAHGSWAHGPWNSYTVLKFSNGSFEWTYNDKLQQRGYYDIDEGVLTITITHGYGKPQYLLGQYSRTYSISNNILTWGSTQFTKI
jgi:hypothetical protein